MHFKDRKEAGGILAERLISETHNFKDPIVLGIPRGGVAVGYAVIEVLRCPLDVVSLRKLPLPSDPEAGFGAVNLDKKVVLNETLLSQIQIGKPSTSS
ncbi:MAG: hypothetical protein FJZ16_04235 [Candidatus Omnitrophica bacterium]|nr:hypothetical protein [Candidatus Omnitrophota bacterium]